MLSKTCTAGGRLVFKNSYSTIAITTIKSRVTRPVRGLSIAPKLYSPQQLKQFHFYNNQRNYSTVKCQTLTSQLKEIKKQGSKLSFPLVKSANLSTTQANQIVEMEDKPFQRLPKHVVPVNYEMVLTPNFGDFTFAGTQNIEIMINEATNEIVMNAAELTINSGVWKDKASGAEQAATIDYDSAVETVTFKFGTSLNKGTSGTLTMEFVGSINDKMKGFYRSKFKGPNGEDRYNGVTQFEATDARRCFPCWDEPAVKATFDISLIVDKDKVALSNMPVKCTAPVGNPDSNRQLVKFERTPIMSTYLVALVIGDFDYIETKSSDGVLCRVYTPPGKKEQGRFALDVVARVLPYYKEYFGIAYCLPKMDLVAIADFSAGAMENWGLVTYRETCLLIDEKQSSTSNKQWVALVVGHEVAHQWFGNLVTMEWWTHLWLNEGYATFVEFLCVDNLFPEFDIWTQFVTETYIRALELDCLENSHPIEVPVGHPSEIDEIFDDISYNKGACIIRMLHHYIGDADFRKGMNLYLKRHQYKNAFTEDLWAALEEASGKPVGAVMGTWTKQMGFPLIRVLSSRQEGTDRVLELSQEKFCTDPNKADGKYKWMIPLTFCSASNPKKAIHSTLMENKTMTVVIPNVAESDWVKLNPGTVGFYRVQYPPEILEQFLPAIQQQLLGPVDRLGLLDDLFALVQSGQTSTTNVLRVLEAFKNEENYTVWSSISNVMSKLNLLLQYTDYHENFKRYGRQLFSAIMDKLGWEAKPNESHLDTMLRTLVLLRMTSFGHDLTIEESKRRLPLHLSGEKPVIADLRSVVYRGVLSGGDEKTFESIIQLYRDSDMLEEKDRIGRSLGAIKNPDLLKRVLEFSISDDVRSQDSVFIITAVGMSKVGREIAWKFFQDNKDIFRERYPGGGLISRLVKYVTEDFVTEQMAQDVEKFFQENSFPGTERTVQQSIESIRLNSAWLKRDEQPIRQYLQNTAK